MEENDLVFRKNTKTQRLLGAWSAQRPRKREGGRTWLRCWWGDQREETLRIRSIQTEGVTVQSTLACSGQTSLGVILGQPLINIVAESPQVCFFTFEARKGPFSLLGNRSGPALGQAPGKQQVPNSCAPRLSQSRRWQGGFEAASRMTGGGGAPPTAPYPFQLRHDLRPPPERPPPCVARPSPTGSRSGLPGWDSPVRPLGLRRAARPSLPPAGRGMSLRSQNCRFWYFKRGFAA